MERKIELWDRNNNYIWGELKGEPLAETHVTTLHSLYIV